MRVLHLAPHPDDETIGAPATLIGLREAGHSIVNCACSLGRAEDADRRREEVAAACRRAGFELICPEPPVAMSASAGDDLSHAQALLEDYLERLLADEQTDLVVSPSPHDRHPAHELVGRAARTVLARRPGAVWWMWGLWADLPLPNLLVAFGPERMGRILFALEAHESQLERSDYRRLVSGRAEANKVLGLERVFGWRADFRGVEGMDLEAPYAEVVSEVVRSGDEWRLGKSRVLTPDQPFADPTALDVSFWIDARSITDVLTWQPRRAGPIG